MGLYPNIPHQAGLKALKEALEKADIKVIKEALEKRDIKKIPREDF